MSLCDLNYQPETFIHLLHSDGVITYENLIMKHYNVPEDYHDPIYFNDVEQSDHKLVENSTYSNLSPKDMRYNNPYLTNKLICENNLTFEEPSNITFLYYDIETYNSNGKFDIVPEVSSRFSHIGIISLVDITNKKIKIFLRSYAGLYSDEKVRKIIWDEYDIEYLNYNDEHEMCRDFLCHLCSYKTITIASSFNGSIGYTNKKIYGYDLPFIYRRANVYKDEWKLLVKHGMKTEYNKYEYTMITQLNNAPNLFFYDYRYLHTIIGKPLYQFEDYKLNSYLKYYGLESKLDIGLSYEEIQRRLLVRDQDISNIIAYCIKDCLVLNELEKKSGLIADRLTYMSVCNVPLHYALYFSYGHMASSAILQRFYKKGIILPQRNHHKLVDRYIGAYTNIEPGLYSDVVQFDIKSMYPNIIIAFNISLETMTDNSTGSSDCRMIRMRDPKLSETYPYVSFKKGDLGVIPSFCLEVITNRDLIKQQLKTEIDESQRIRLTKIEKSLKTIANSTYGLTGTEFSVIYNVLCAASVTSAGRAIIQIVDQILLDNHCKPIAIDTDGVSFQIDRSIIDCKDKLYQLLRLTNETLAHRLKTDRIVLELDTKDIYAKFYAPNKKKSYAYIPYLGIDEMFGTRRTGDIVINGIGWSLYSSNNIKTSIKNFFHDILSGDEDKVPMKLIEYKNFHIQRLQTLTDIRILIDYAQRIKLGTSRGKLLTEKYGLTGDVGYFVPLLIGKNKTESLYPLKHQIESRLDQLNILEMVNYIYSPLKKFFEDNVSQKTVREDMSSGDILYRDDTCMQFFVANIDMLYDLTSQNKKTSYHEVITSNYNRAFFDIDYKQEQHIANLNEVIKEFTTFIARTAQYTDIIAISNASSSSKLSLHITLPRLVIDLNYNETLARLFNSHMCGYYCDTSIYSLNKSLRIANTYKYKDGCFERKLEIMNGIAFHHTIITNIEDLPITRTPYYFSDTPIFDLPSCVIPIASEAITIIDRYVIENDMIVLSANSGYVRARFRGACLVCNRSHDSDNQYFIHSGGYVKLKCYRNDFSDDKKPAIIVGKLPCKNDSFITSMSGKYEAVKKHQVNYDGIIVNEKYINFDIYKTKNTYIRSALGTGKTESLIKQLDKKQVILLITFRRTFASDITKRYNDAGFNFTNYLDLDCKYYDNFKFPQLVLQIDSLHKYIISRSVDIVICDEIESILSQLKETKDLNAEVTFFYQLLLSAKRCVFLDGMLNNSAIELLQIMTDNPSYNIITNLYKPKDDYSCIIRSIAYNGITDYNMFTYLYTLLLNDKKVAVMCSSQTETKTIVLAIEKYIPSKKIKMYTGADADRISHNSESVKNQRHLKQFDFSKGLNNVLIEEQPDLLIFTSTMTAGVSINLEYFDHFIGCLFSHTTDILSFVQSLHRVRTVKSKTIELYFHNVKSYLPTTMADMNKVLKLQNYNFNRDTSYTEMYLKVRKNAMQVYAAEILLQSLHMMGYNITFENSIAFDIPMFKTEFDRLKIEVNPRREVKTLIANFLEEQKSGNIMATMIMISMEYFRILMSENQLDSFVEAGGNDTVYRDKWYIEICLYAGFRAEEISDPRFHTIENAEKLLFVINHIELYKNRYYSGNVGSEKLQELLDTEFRNKQVQEKLDVVIKNTDKVISKIDKMLRIDRARELIQNVEVGKSYKKEEFMAITEQWVDSVRSIYPELKLNHNTIKILNEFCSRLGYMWESKQMGRGNDRAMVYRIVVI